MSSKDRQDEGHRRWIFVLSLLLSLTVIGLILSVYFTEHRSILLSNLLIGITGSIVCSGIVLFFSEILFKNLEAQTMNAKILGEIKSINVNLSEQSQTVHAAQTADSLFRISDALRSSTKVSMLGYDLSDVFENYSDEITRFLDRGGELDIVLVKYSGLTEKLIAEHTSAPEKFEKGYTYAKRKINEIQKKRHGGRLSLYKTSWPTSYRAIICEGHESGIARIDLIPFSMKQPYENHRVIILRLEDNGDHFRYFRSSFDYILREDAQPSQLSTR